MIHHTATCLKASQKAYRSAVLKIRSGNRDNLGIISHIFCDTSLEPCLIETVLMKGHNLFFIHWLVGCFGLNGPLRQYFGLYRAVSQREGEREERRRNDS